MMTDLSPIVWLEILRSKVISDNAIITLSLIDIVDKLKRQNGVPEF